jgi:hypothetical protein
LSLEGQMQYLAAQIEELRSVMSALTVAIEGLTSAAVEEVEVKKAPFIEVIKPDDPRYAEEIKAFHQDSIFEPRLSVFADLTPSNNAVQDQGAITQKCGDLDQPRQKPAGKRRHHYPKITYSSCCRAPDRKKSAKDGKCAECR